jgi:hypothetical protein
MHYMYLRRLKWLSSRYRAHIHTQIPLQLSLLLSAFVVNIDAHLCKISCDFAISERERIFFLFSKSPWVHTKRVFKPFQRTAKKKFMIETKWPKSISTTTLISPSCEFLCWEIKNIFLCSWERLLEDWQFLWIGCWFGQNYIISSSLCQFSIIFNWVF